MLAAPRSVPAAVSSAPPTTRRLDRQPNSRSPLRLAYRTPRPTQGSRSPPPMWSGGRSGPNLRASYRRLAYYGARILKRHPPLRRPPRQPGKCQMTALGASASPLHGLGEAAIWCTPDRADACDRAGRAPQRPLPRGPSNGAVEWKTAIRSPTANATDAPETPHIGTNEQERHV